MMTGIIDYGSGNFTSVFNAVSLVTNHIQIVTSQKDFAKCDRIILPGVGAFKHAIEKLESLNIVDELKHEVLEMKKPFLGICVGMQILAERGFEFEEVKGIGLVRGDVCKYNFSDNQELLLPHIGWNSVSGFEANPLFKEIDEKDADFYFVNSYHLVSEDKAARFTYTNYGYDFISAFQKENIFGVQFHPEKSQHNGLKILKNFINYA